MGKSKRIQKQNPTGKKLKRSLRGSMSKMEPRMYVLGRNDLPSQYANVQMGHAVAEYCLRYGHALEWDNGTMVYLGVKDTGELIDYWLRVRKLYLHSTPFNEPDLGDEFTAFACVVNDIKHKQIFSKLKLKGS